LNISYDEIKNLLVTPFAEGAFAIIYKIEWNGKIVAGKVLKPIGDLEETEFKTEVGAMSKLQHKNIIQCVGACSQPPNYVILTEYAENGSLKKYLLDKKHLEWSQIIDFSTQIAEGLNYMHTRSPKGIHRDLKADNILITSDFTLKLADFGLSKIKSQTLENLSASKSKNSTTTNSLEESVVNLTLSGVVGTAAWIAPEFLEQNPYNEKIDVYSYGVVLWEIVASLHAPKAYLKYTQRDNYSLMMRVLTMNERPDIPDTCPAKFAKLISDCWNSNPKKRLGIALVLEILKKFGSSIDVWK